MSPWLKFDDSIGDDARLVTVGALGAGLLLFAIGFSNRNLSDGIVPAAAIRRFNGVNTREALEVALSALLACGVFKSETVSGIESFVIHPDYLGLQPTKAQVLKDREGRRRQKAASGRLGGLAKSAARRQRRASTLVADASQEGSAEVAPFPVPVPSERSTAADASAPPQREKDNEATHELLMVLFEEVWDREETLPDRVAAVKELLRVRRMTATNSAINSAESVVNHVRQKMQSDHGPRGGGGTSSDWSRVGAFR